MKRLIALMVAILACVLSFLLGVDQGAKKVPDVIERTEYVEVVKEVSATCPECPVCEEPELYELKVEKNYIWLYRPDGTPVGFWEKKFGE